MFNTEITVVIIVNALVVFKPKEVNMSGLAKANNESAPTIKLIQNVFDAKIDLIMIFGFYWLVIIKCKVFSLSPNV